jgi:hypothetical protein
MILGFTSLNTADWWINKISGCWGKNHVWEKDVEDGEL